MYSFKSVIISLLIISILLCNVSQAFGAENNCYKLYPQTPDAELGPKDYCGTGLALADINGDGYKDIIVSNGNDMATQKMVVYYNDKHGKFPTEPSWYSSDAAYNGNLAVGDINKDGHIDVAVSIFLGSDKNYSTGGVKVYYNLGEELEKTPSFRSQDGYPSFGCALGDADGDGDLDLAVACGEPIAEIESFAASGKCRQDNTTSAKNSDTGKIRQLPPFRSYGRIYYNNNGKFSPVADWNSETTLISYDVCFGDLNQDGFLDVIFTNPNTIAYLSDSTGTVSMKSGWQSKDEDYFANQIVFANTLLAKTSEPYAKLTPSLIVANNKYMGGGYGHFNLYNFTAPYIIDYYPYTSTPDWSSSKGGWSAGVCLADVNQDGLLDLLAGRWAEPGSRKLGSPFLIYPGHGTTFSETPCYSSENIFVVEEIAVADLDRKGAEPYSAEFSVVRDETAILYLPHHNIESIMSVSKKGKLLPSADYTYVPGQNWISFTERLHENDSVIVKYEFSDYPDAVVTAWDCNKGNFIYYNLN